MRISQLLVYSLRALVLLADRPAGACVSGAEVAAVLGLPQRVVEQQLSRLTRRGLLTSRRGSGGGHALARPASEITVSDVVRAIEGSAMDVPHTSDSGVAEFWAEAAAAFDEILERTTIASLAERQRAIDASGSNLYYI
jgi:Rrf2 family protein